MYILYKASIRWNKNISRRFSINGVSRGKDVEMFKEQKNSRRGTSSAAAALNGPVVQRQDAPPARVKRRFESGRGLHSSSRHAA